jgi:thioredoxin-related protein
MRYLVRTLLLLILVVALLPVSMAAELIVFSRPDCVWCEAWERDVGAIFPRTDEAQYLHLTRVDISEPLPERLRNLKGVNYTPTFVVLDEKREIGRILGYTGEGYFWWELQKIIKKLPPPKAE